MISRVPVARLLDAAGDAAWECRSKTAAVRAAHQAIRSGSGEEPAEAFAVWRRAVGYDGPDFGAFLTDRHRDCGGIAISLKRAAFMAEQAARSSR